MKTSPLLASARGGCTSVASETLILPSALGCCTTVASVSEGEVYRDSDLHASQCSDSHLHESQYSEGETFNDRERTLKIGTDWMNQRSNYCTFAPYPGVAMPDLQEGEGIELTHGEGKFQDSNIMNSWEDSNWHNEEEVWDDTCDADGEMRSDFSSCGSSRQPSAPPDSPQVLPSAWGSSPRRAGNSFSYCSLHHPSEEYSPPAVVVFRRSSGDTYSSPIYGGASAGLRKACIEFSKSSARRGKMFN